MNGWKQTIGAGAAAATLLVSALVAPAPASATVLNCDTGRHNNDPDVGYALCSNPTGDTYEFRAVITCGLAPDVKGDWKRVPPGGVEQSQGKCAFYSSGVGAVGVDERRL
ncbi:hypothetical protein HII36_44045 [Nonomuraea sp. NN258]|uniref:hypothetical protein n=1 Tax=Nonomuraea antri TaxID=2730852 RepID=UPI001569DFF3|nr:hypothetical protein [Nonomuraea antri]NRQ38751.1 hypothetical protein [Nonomuraea antri]